MRRSTLSTTNEQLPGDASSSVSPLMPLPCSSAPSSVPSTRVSVSVVVVLPLIYHLRRTSSTSEPNVGNRAEAVALDRTSALAHKGQLGRASLERAVK